MTLLKASSDAVMLNELGASPVKFINLCEHALVISVRWDPNAACAISDFSV
jgi:hypothetical protein